ncbi:hypothetical protein ACHAWF_014755 [Thalassiosira exigua]
MTKSSFLNSDELCAPPEVCGDDAEAGKQEHLLSQTTNDNDGRITVFVKRDKPLLVAIAAMVILMNIKKLSHVLYPLEIFSTWIHEMSHGIAAVLVGGGISKLLIYPDTSGMAWTYTDGSSWKRGFVASGGYTGTAVLGMILLLFRRTYRGPTYGTIGLGVIMILSCILYVRNTFALVMLPLTAVVFILCAWQLKAKHLSYLYSFLAATCSFNAVDNISELYGPVGYVNGEEATSDAHTVAEHWGGTNLSWATFWLIFALGCSAVGLLFAFDGQTYKKDQKQKGASIGGGGQTHKKVIKQRDASNGAKPAKADQTVLPVAVPVGMPVPSAPAWSQVY